MFIFSPNIEQYIEGAKPLGVSSITPLEPPYIQVIKGKHTIKQKLGSFLAKTFNPEKVKDLVEEYKEINSDLSQYKIEYSTNYVEIYEHPLYAINSTSKSCMTGKTCVKVYGYDSRLSLLLIYKNSKLIGRTLVRSDAMKYVRLYIDHNEIKSHVAKAIVERQGYSEGDLEGIHLEYEELDGQVTCPYLDKVSNFGIIDNSFLEITEYGPLEGSTTTGYVELEEKYDCEHCGNRKPIDDITFIHGETAICQYCLRNNYTLYNDEYYLIEDCITNNSTGELIPTDCIDNEDISCTENGEWYNSDEVICIDDCYYHIDECVKLCVNDEDDNSHCLENDAIYNPEELVYLPKGYWIRQQIEEVLEEIQNKLDQLKIDLFEEKENLELSNEEIDTLTEEITKIKNLI